MRELLTDRSVASLASVSFTGRIIGRGATYGMYVYIARVLGAEALGAFTAGILLVQLGGKTAQFGMINTVKKYVPVFQTESSGRLTGVVSTALATALLAGLLISALTFPFRESIIRIAGEATLRGSFVLIWGIPLFGVYTVCEAVATAFKRTEYAVYIRDFGRAGVGLLSVVVASMFERTVFAISVGYLVALGTASLLGIYLLYRLGCFEDIHQPEFQIRETYRYSLQMFPQSISRSATRWGDVAVLVLFVSATQVGWYQASYQTAVLLLFAVVSIESIYPPLASELYSNDRHETLRTLSTLAVKWTTLLTLFATAFVVVFRKEILLLFGQSFVAAQWVLAILAIGRGVNAVTGPVGFLLSMTEYERLEMWNNALAAVVNVALNFLFVPLFGLLGAAVATTVTLVLLNFGRVAEIRVVHGYWTFSSRHLRSLIPVGSGVALMIAVRRLVELEPIFVLFLGAVASSSVFLCATALVSVSEEDRLLISSVDDL